MLNDQMLNKKWTDVEIVAFDLETSGAYPLGSEIVEFGAVKWRGGQIVDQYQTLLKPSEPMSVFNMGIHGITNEMVAEAPLIADKIAEIKHFFGNALLMAHHAPFDLGFLAIEFEKNKITIPTGPVVCTSLLSRKIIPESINHKLQTLISFLKIEKGTAHRAHDDARACLMVGLECFRRMGEQATVQDVLSEVGKDLSWSHYSVLQNSNPLMKMIVQCLLEKRSMDISYKSGGDNPGKKKSKKSKSHSQQMQLLTDSGAEAAASASQTRRITPQGLVRNPDGDFVMALCHRDAVPKRFYLSKISDAEISY